MLASAQSVSSATSSLSSSALGLFSKKSSAGPSHCARLCDARLHGASSRVVAYALVYLAILLLLATFSFEKREFK
jgi:hypothetical protein